MSNGNGTGQQTVGADSVRAEAKDFFNGNQSAADSTNEQPAPKSSISDKAKFPILSQAALYGLAGDIVRTIEPHTEADSSALLIQLLAGFGNLINRTAYYRIGADYHYTKINAVLVGDTARGRKGTSWSEVERVLVRVDESFLYCIQSGLSSGEGLIYHVRDEQTKTTPIKEKGRIVDYQEEIFDKGATEKRAFVVESEFARVLRVIQRDGNTLSPVIRDAWDKDRLSVMTKAAIKASGVHISIVGHITLAELIRNLEETETANGFANRFLWFCVRRSKLLPEGGNLNEGDLNPFITKLRDAAVFARDAHELKRDDDARELWHKVYKRLSDGYGGLVGSVTSRATAYVMRLACIYALLDCSSKIKVVHLRAALAVWQYCEDSAKYIFGMTLGDKVADAILAGLRAAGCGLDRTEINNLFNRNRTAHEIETALQSLLELERIEKIEEKTGGRPREVFNLLADELNEKNEISLSDEQPESDLNSFNSFNSSPETKTNQAEICPDCKINLTQSADGKLFCEFCNFTIENVSA